MADPAPDTVSDSAAMGESIHASLLEPQRMQQTSPIPGPSAEAPVQNLPAFSLSSRQTPSFRRPAASGNTQHNPGASSRFAKERSSSRSDQAAKLLSETSIQPFARDAYQGSASSRRSTDQTTAADRCITTQSRGHSRLQHP